MKIFVCGLSGSGKTTFAQHLGQLYHLNIISTDDFYKQDYEGDWERPEAFEMDALISAVTKA